MDGKGEIKKLQKNPAVKMIGNVVYRTVIRISNTEPVLLSNHINAKTPKKGY